MQRLAITLTLSSMLYGCAGYQPKDLFAQSKHWLEKTSERLETLNSANPKPQNYDAEVNTLFAQPYIDPLTDYLNRHLDDENRAEPLRKVSTERKIRCQKIANKYADRPLTQDSLNLYKAGYNYSCPKDVEAFALLLAGTEKAETSESASAPTDTSPVADKPVLDQAIVSNVNKEQLNDCYLLTTISNFREAKQACLSPASEGDARAQLNMAIIHKAMGEYPQSFEWAEKAQDYSPRARYLLGELYASGQGVKQNDEAAFHAFEKAGEQGYPDAQYMTAWCYESGIGTRKNPEQALSWYQRAALNNNVPAKHSLGALLVQQSSTPSSIQNGQNWLIQAARTGYDESALLLGQLLQKSDLPDDKAKALVWYEVAQQQGSTEAVELAKNLRKDVSPEALSTARQQIHRILDGESNG